jgi:transposase
MRMKRPFARRPPFIAHERGAVSSRKFPRAENATRKKILGAVSVPDGDFVWRHQIEYFNARTYLSFVDGELLPHYYRRRHRVYLIQDNASYHKKPEVLEFFAKHGRQIEVFALPPYSPDFNATERLWHCTRKQSTHNRYFDRPAALCQSLFTTFTDMQKTSRKNSRPADAFFLKP